jgi:hypothetical protein
VRTPAHLLLGAAAGAAPDVLLLAFGWRRTWLPESHPLVRAHRFLHSPAGLVVPLLLGWGSHVVADRYSTHRTEVTR